MDMEHEDFENGVRAIRLKGRMDVEGTGQIDLKFTGVAVTGGSLVVVDLTEVDFLSSIGMGVLVRSAKALMLRQGRMVFFNPQPHVARVLASTQIDQIVPVFYDLDAALAAVRNGG